ncbi:MAG: transcriptional repressor LexA [Acidimicrobiia bacterium]|jgi:repressor LexA|nr:transcriptional repressor LexA [Acidimicrobiia bacterium]
MRATDFRQARLQLGLTQAQLAEQLKTTRRSIIRYEVGTRRIPGMAALLLSTFGTAQVVLAGIVAAGEPIEPIAQMERVDVPKSMVGRGETFALRVKGQSMRDEGILPGDVVVVQKQQTARNGQTVIALVNGEATIKTYYRKAGTIELHPANDTMQPIIVQAHDTFRIEGLVVGVIRHLKK